MITNISELFHEKTGTCLNIVVEDDQVLNGLNSDELSVEIVMSVGGTEGYGATTAG